MTSSGSRPPDSSHTSHRLTRWRVTSKFGFARLTPARSSMNTREALYRGPPIASQYSWKDTRYAVGLRCPASHRTPAPKSVGPNRPAIRSASFDANHFHALANPVRRKVHAAGTPALRHDLLDHLLTEHLELRFLPGARHSGPPGIALRTDG